MKLAISNLAWSKEKDHEVLKLLKKYEIGGIEVAFTKIWPKPTAVPKVELINYKNFWQKRGIEIVAISSLLFRHPELTIFENSLSRKQTLSYLKKMIKIAELMGAGVVIFGSPKNRLIGKLDLQKVQEIGVDFFHELGDFCKKHSINFALEPNPTVYGADFITSTPEAIVFCQKVNHPNFGINLDLSTMTINKENLERTIERARPYSFHFHISEPNLARIPQSGTNHQAASQALTKNNFKHWVSIEMPLSEDLPHLKIINSTLKFVSKIYGNQTHQI